MLEARKLLRKTRLLMRQKMQMVLIVQQFMQKVMKHLRKTRVLMKQKQLQAAR